MKGQNNAPERLEDNYLIANQKCLYQNAVHADKEYYPLKQLLDTRTNLLSVTKNSTL
jgi:hypothetical protein